MKIDSSEFMYGVFQSGRHRMPDVAVYVQALAPVLDAVHHQRSFVVELPVGVAGSVSALGEYAADAVDAHWANGPAVGSAHNDILAVLDAAVIDLARLTDAGSSEPVSALGYALHSLPHLLRVPENFRPELYAFSLGIAAKHWDELSEPLRDAFCRLVGQKLAHAILLKVGHNRTA